MHQSGLLKNFSKTMPTGTYLLVLIQVFSTLSFSVLYSTLILYATQRLHISDALATSITGSFIALNYFLHLISGYIGGRYLSYRSVFSISMILQIVGCLIIAIPNTITLLWGLAVYLGGSGLSITCINCMLTQLFSSEDKRRESAFLWNYSGMNIGFFIGFSIGGYFYLQQEYIILFLLSASANLISILLTIYNWRKIKDKNTIYIQLSTKKRYKAHLLGFSVIFMLIFIIRGLLEYADFCNKLILIVGMVMLTFIAILATRQPIIARRKMLAYIILSISSFIFFTLYQLAPIGLNLFIERNVDLKLFGWLIAPQWVQNINTIVIIIGGPLLSIVFTKMRKNGVLLSSSLQFSIALILIGIAFAILPIGINLANKTGLVSFYWILISYILQSIGELFISPIGYSTVGELAPVNLVGLMMGIWLMIKGVAAIMSNIFSKVALGTSNTINPLLTNTSYSHAFGLLGWSAIIAGLLLLAMVPLINHLMYERNTPLPE